SDHREDRETHPSVSGAGGGPGDAARPASRPRLERRDGERPGDPGRVAPGSGEDGGAHRPTGRGADMSHRASEQEKNLVIDYGGQTSQLIARRVRDLSVYCELVPCHLSTDEIAASSPRGLILSGGPDSVGAPGAPGLDPRLTALGIPVLGICYG